MGLELDRRGSESRFAAYVETLTTALGHADRAAPFRSYCTGLLLPGPRKSVEPMAARVAPAQVRATHQSLHHLVASADWSDEAVLSVVRQQVLPAMARSGPGSSTTPAFPRRERIQSAWRGSTAASSANRTIVKSR